jgi:hypothetical protein
MKDPQRTLFSKWTFSKSKKNEKYVDSPKEFFLLERDKSSTRIWVGTLIFLSSEILHLEGSPNIILDLRLFQNFFYR